MMVKLEPGASKPDGTDTKAKAKKVKYDFRLAETWENTRLIRSLVRERKQLVVWPSAKQENLISLEALGTNSRSMCVLARHWCETNTVVKAPSVAYLKAQVGLSNVIAKMWAPASFFGGVTCCCTCLIAGVETAEGGPSNRERSGSAP